LAQARERTTDRSELLFFRRVRQDGQRHDWTNSWYGGHQSAAILSRAIVPLSSSASLAMADEAAAHENVPDNFTTVGEKNWQTPTEG
jgi:hypothetical protein